MRSRWPIVVLVALLLMVIGGAAWMVLSDAPTSTGDAIQSEAGLRSEPPPESGSTARPPDARTEQSGVVTGRLRDERTGAWVDGGAVRIVPKGADPLEAETDAGGRFRLQRVPAGAALDVAFRAAGVGSREQAIDALESGEVRDLGTLWISRPARLTVIVLAPDGAPLPAANVRVRAAVWSNAPGPVEHAEVTDATGQAVFEELPAAPWYVRAVAPGLAPAEERGRPLAPGQERTLTLRTSLAFSLRGRVTDPDGRPLAGVRVSPFQEGREWAGTQLPGDVVITAEDGTYAFDDLAAGKTTLRAGYADTYPSEVGSVWVPADHPYDFTLRPGGVIVGLVIDADGDPVPGARVSASGQSAGTTTHAQAETGLDGRYRIDGLLEAVGVHVRARAEGHLESSWTGEKFDLGPGESITHDLTLRSGARISGVVTDGVGPVPGAIVHVETEGQRLHESVSRADSAGRYELTVPVPIRTTLTATRAGYHLPESPDRVLRLEAGDEREIDLELTRNVILRGRCELADGTPAAGVGIRWQPASSAVHRAIVTAFSDSEGQFELAGAVAGEAGQFETWHREFRPVPPLPWVRVESNAPVEGLRFVVQRLTPHSVSGTARYDDGRPATDAVITSDGAPATRAASDGSFRVDFRTRVQGETIVATARGVYATAVAQFEPGETQAQVEMVLGGGLPVTGTVLGDGIPLVGVQVALGVDRVVVGLTDERGAFRIDDLPEGDALLWLLAEGFGLRHAMVKVPQRQPLRMEFQRLQDLRGRVVESDGRGIARADIRVTPHGSRRRNVLWGDHVVTDEEGRFVVRGLEPEAAQVIVYPTRHSESFLEAYAQLQEGRWEDEVRIEVELAGLIEGTLTDADGLPARAGQIRAHAAVGTASAISWPDERGRFRLVGLPAGKYVVAALEGDRTVASSAQVETGTRDLRLVAMEAGSISGVLRTADGEPAPSRLLRALPLGMATTGLQALPPVAMTRTGADGRFTLGPLPEGRYRVCAAEPDNADYRVPLGSETGVEAGATGVGLRLPRRHTLVLVVLNDAGDRVGHRGLELRHLPTGRRVRVDPSEDPKHKITKLLSGRYEVSGWIADPSGRPRNRKLGTVLGEAGRAELRPE